MDGPITDAPQFGHFVQWVFYVLIFGCSVFGVSCLRGIQTSVAELNIKIAVILERLAGHDERLKKLEKRVED